MNIVQRNGIHRDIKEANNQTYIPIEALEEKKDEGVGIEITITLTIGLLLFIINGAAFLNLAWKKRTAQKQFRRNLEVSCGGDRELIMALQGSNWRQRAQDSTKEFNIAPDSRNSLVVALMRNFRIKSDKGQKHNIN